MRSAYPSLLHTLQTKSVSFCIIPTSLRFFISCFISPLGRAGWDLSTGCHHLITSFCNKECRVPHIPTLRAPLRSKVAGLWKGGHSQTPVKTHCVQNHSQASAAKHRLGQFITSWQEESLKKTHHRGGHVPSGNAGV